MKKLFAISAVVAMVVLSTVSLGTEAVAQQAGNAQVDLFHKPFGAAVDCQGNGANSGVPDGGFVNAHINLQRGMLIFNVHVQDVLPNTTYDVFVRCIGGLGTLKTNSQGVGNTTFKIPAGGIPQTFAIDMHAQPFQIPTLDTLVSEPITLPSQFCNVGGTTSCVSDNGPCIAADPKCRERPIPEDAECWCTHCANQANYCATLVEHKRCDGNC